MEDLEVGEFEELRALQLRCAGSTEEKRINVKVGAKGRYGSVLQFEVDGGAAVFENGLLDCGIGFLPGVVYSDYSLIYADALMDLHAGNMTLEGGLHVKHSALKYDTDFGLMLPAFTCDFKAVYDFSPRLYAGGRVVTSSSRKGNCLAPDASACRQWHTRRPYPMTA